ncbi:cell division protein SepF [Rubrobacter aplysinae]|uniref:cell division protein SepF n=1 Tax=Rubrobacter aplysinae TaxID=909625 RepID=UPI00069F9042|nr:cell division protein SepF [Rubrobacter aplysinae]
MGVKDSLDRMAAWFGFGTEDEYYDDEYEDERAEDRQGERYRDRRGGELAATGAAGSTGAAGAGDGSEGPRRYGRQDRSSAFGTSLGDLFGSEPPARERGGSQGQHLRAVPDNNSTPAKVSVLEPAAFNDAQALADRFKRQQPVILNLQNVDVELSRRMVDFCSGLTYALDGQIQSVANRVFLLTPRNVEVSAEERKRLAERAFFNQL